MFEVRQRISEPALTTHDGCGGEVHRLLSPAPFILKGEGWYVTDYPSEARKKAKEAEKPAASDKSAPTGDKSSSDKGSSDKSSTTTPSAPASSSTPKSD